MDIEAILKPDGDDLSTFEGLIQRVRWYQLIEIQLFNTLGEWSHSHFPVGLPSHFYVTFGIHARYHAWNAELLRGLIPTAGQAFAGGSEVYSAELFDQESPVGDMYELLYDSIIPSLASTYQLHLNSASPVSDGPIIRVMSLMLSSKSVWSTKPSGD